MKNKAVNDVITSYPLEIQHKVGEIRQLIYNIATDIKEIGPIEETLKWGEPSYLTSQSQSGSTIRVAWKSTCPEHYGIYFNCKTTLVDTFRTLYPKSFTYEKNRAIILHKNDDINNDELLHCITMALTYHLKMTS